MRFPFTFLGLIAMGMGLWVALYLAFHPGMDPASVWISYGTAAVVFGFGVYVLVRRLRRGPDN